MLNTKFNKLHPMDMGERIAHARASAGLTQAALARAVGVSKGAVSQWEKGAVKDLRMPNLFAIEDATGFNARWSALGEGRERPTAKQPVKVEEISNQLDRKSIIKLLRVAAELLAEK
jgi:transcriptional regulator with XRE-family HTH domain